MSKGRGALVIGGGAFGTSIATVLSHNVDRVALQVRDPELRGQLCVGENRKYLKGKTLPSNLEAFEYWEELEFPFDDVEVVVFGLPMPAISSYFQDNRAYIEKILSMGIPIVSLAKGIDSDSLLLPDDLFYQLFPTYRDSFCFLSGPSFAAEIVERQITLVSLAGRSRDNLVKISSLMETSYFKVFPTYDIKGLLLGGALKNILAIASGVIEGLGYNHNTRAAMLTRGIVEMLRFGKVFNARSETFYGLSGMGDLILTATGGASRNKWFGTQLAKGLSASEIFQQHRVVVEGYKTTKAAHMLAERYHIRTRIFKGLYHVMYDDAPVKNVIEELMSLPAKFDSDY